MMRGWQDVFLALDGVSHAYDGRSVFRQLSLKVGAGLNWLQAPNGAGKTTLLKLVAGLLPLAEGTLTVLGECQRRNALAYRREVFWCGPDQLPYFPLTVAEYIGFVRNLYPRFDDDTASAHAVAFDVVRYMRTPIAQLSTGTQRKVWLVAALSCGASVILLDEPFSGLDESATRHLKQHLARASRQMRSAWVVASHIDIVEDGEVTPTIIQLGSA